MPHPARAHVVICGAGVIGAAVAYYLSLRGREPPTLSSRITLLPRLCP